MKVSLAKNVWCAYLVKRGDFFKKSLIARNSCPLPLRLALQGAATFRLT